MSKGCALLLLLGALVAGPALAQQASVRIAADSVAVGERFLLVVRVLSDEGAVVPPAPGAVGDLELLRATGTGSRIGSPLPPGARLDTFVYEAAAFAVDSLVVPSLTVRLLRGADTTRVQTAPFVLPMQALVRDSTARLRPTHPLASFGLPWWLFAGAALVAVAVAYGLLRWWQRRPKPALPLTPAAPARTARAHYLALLSALDARIPTTVTEARAFALALADAVRVYAEAQTGLATREMTSSTLVRGLDRLERSRKVAPGAAALARRVLAVADLGRYASTCPPRTDAEAALAAARDLAPALDARPPAPRPTAVPKTPKAGTARRDASEFAPPTTPAPTA